jgi:glucose/arabinose dehydrogenase
MRAHQIGLILLLAAATPRATRAGDPLAGFVDTSYVAGLSQPTAVAFLPDGRLLITERGGTGGAGTAALKLFDGTGTKTLLTLPVCTDGEMGLLGVAVDPDFACNGFVYLYRTKAGTGGCETSPGRFNQVVRGTMAGGSVDAGSLTILVDGIRTDNGNHDGGVLRIGPDQKLYVGVGDTGRGDNQGGPGSSTNPYAQDLSSLNGKILRLNLDGSVPTDNPFVGTAGARGEVWAYGLRNPFRMSFDGSTGTLWIGDVGDETVEEIDLGVAGGNYGWPHCEGTLPPGCERPGDIDPIFTYPHSGPSSLGACLIGGAFAGSAFGPLAGDYVFGDCIASVVYRVTPNAARDGLAGAPAPAATNAGTPSDFVTGPDGAIYYVADGDGEIRRLAAVPSSMTSSVLTTSTTTPTCPSPTTTTVSSSTTTSSSPTTSTTVLTPPSSSTPTLPCTTPSCILGAALTSTACVEQFIPERVIRKLSRAETLIQRATTTGARKARKVRQRARRLLRQAGMTATHVAKRRKGKLSTACAAALRDAAGRAATGL